MQNVYRSNNHATTYQEIDSIRVVMRQIFLTMLIKFRLNNIALRLYILMLQHASLHHFSVNLKPSLTISFQQQTYEQHSVSKGRICFCLR